MIASKRWYILYKGYRKPTGTNSIQVYVDCVAANSPKQGMYSQIKKRESRLLPVTLLQKVGQWQCALNKRSRFDQSIEFFGQNGRFVRVTKSFFGYYFRKPVERDGVRITWMLSCLRVPCDACHNQLKQFEQFYLNLLLILHHNKMYEVVKTIHISNNILISR